MIFSLAMLKHFIDLLIEQQLLKEQEEQNSVSKEIYLDMDGVLVNYEKGVDLSKDLFEPKQELLNVLKGMPELGKLSEDELRERLQGQQREPGLKALKRAFNKFLTMKYQVSGEQDFYLNLEPLPDAEELIDGIIALNKGKLPHILTAPLDRNSDSCERDKKAWMEKHFPGKFDQFFCTKDKYRFAQNNPNNILIDDRTKNTSPFKSNGGTTILHKNTRQTLKKLEQLLLPSPSPTTALTEKLKQQPTQQPQPQPRPTSMKEQQQQAPTAVNIKKNISYTALVLSSADHQKLLEIVPVPDGWEPIAHHVTLNMGAWKGPPELLGQKFAIEVVSYANDNLVIAAGVSIADKTIPSKNNPHITIAVNREAGGKPAMSNKLDWTMESRLDNGSLSIEGTLIEVEQGENKFSDEY